MAPRYGSPAQLEWQKFPEPLPIVRLWTRIMLREILMLPDKRSAASMECGPVRGQERAWRRLHPAGRKGRRLRSPSWRASAVKGMESDRNRCVAIA